MKTFNPNKKILIEIHAPTNPVDGYTIYDISFPTINRVITRKADDSDIEDMLSMREYHTFEIGQQYRFSVPASVLTEKFQYLYS